LQAALGVAQIEQIDGFLERKRRMAKRYGELLASVPGLQIQAQESWSRPVFWMYGIVLDEDTGYTARTFAAALTKAGIQVRPFFVGMHEQPVFHRMGLFHGESYPVAERLSRQGLYLPSGLALTEEQIDTVGRTIQDLLCKGKEAGHAGI
jgi:perosamine synthetase